jgi:hypothetical protein
MKGGGDYLGGRGLAQFLILWQISVGTRAARDFSVLLPQCHLIETHIVVKEAVMIPRNFLHSLAAYEDNHEKPNSN